VLKSFQDEDMLATDMHYYIYAGASGAVWRKDIRDIVVIIMRQMMSEHRLIAALRRHFSRRY
jgi:hypothetical protein